MDGNVETVLGIYAAFGEGDVAHILDQMRDDVDWDQGIRDTGIAYLTPGRGKDHVMAFFQALMSSVEFTVFEPGKPCASDDTVMVAVREAGRNLSTRAPLEEDIFVHIWTFGEDGKIVSFRHVGDWAIHQAAASATTVDPVAASR